MTRNTILYKMILLIAALGIVLTSCKKDDDDDNGTTSFTMSSLKAGSIDMNGATPPNNVPANATITATFSANVNASTATNDNIKLLRDYDDTDMVLNITVSGSTVTIESAEGLGNGTLYLFSITSGLKSSDGQSLNAIDRSFTTEGTFVPSGQVAHWGFEDNPNDDVGNYNPDADGIVDLSYAESHSATAGKAAVFNGTSTIVEIPNGDQLMETNDFTLSFWAKAEDAGHGHFIIGLAAFYGFQFELYGGFDGFKMPVTYNVPDGEPSGGDMVYNGDGLTKDNGGWRGCTISQPDDDLPGTLQDKWFHFTYVYNNESRERRMYLNGDLIKVEDFDLWFDDDGEPYPETTIDGLKYNGTEPAVYPILTFGFVHARIGTLWDTEPWGNYDSPDSNHFQGMLDDVRIFHKPLTDQEISLMYDSEAK
ncbi:MAG: Ig-like domain-containing protein [Bacteroidetes bacterium]|nr:Ig-like domain-containing protein [Bacteroidota bacterium]